MEGHNFVEESASADEIFERMFVVQSDEIGEDTCEPFCIEVTVESTPLKFVIDTGSSITAISEGSWRESEQLHKLPLVSTTRKFKAHNGVRMIPLGMLRVNARCINRSGRLELFVLPGDTKIPIIGRDWLQFLGIIRFEGY